jgi:hypothetical protein
MVLTWLELAWLEAGSALSAVSRSELESIAEIPKTGSGALYMRGADMTMSVHGRKRHHGCSRLR